MSNVNADATQLLTILKNMRTSISSIETTRSSVKMKYQQLGIGWNDKKYDELGTIVKDCNKALNDILQIMLQAEKYVASLAKSVQEYDNVNLDTPSARNSFLQGLQTPNVGNSSYQYCLGVLTQGSTPDGYIAVISQRHENAEQNVREVFDHFAGKLMIQDSEYPPDQTAHYSPGNYIGHSRGVYYNAASDMTNGARAGVAAAQYELARIYIDKEMGDACFIGGANPYIGCERWLKKAAEQNYIYAEELLADKYYEGAYIVKDVKAAIYWYEKAANQGSVYAMYQAGYVYYTVPIDYNKAGQWFSLAAEKGNKDAEDVLRNHLRYNRFTKKWDAIR